jgi:hypothetical protein
VENKSIKYLYLGSKSIFLRLEGRERKGKRE